MLSILENYSDFKYSCDYVTRENSQNYVVYILVNGSLNMSKGGKLPPKLSIVSLNLVPINFKSSEFSRSAYSNIENASALRTSAHLYE